MQPDNIVVRVFVVRVQTTQSARVASFASRENASKETVALRRIAQADRCVTTTNVRLAHKTQTVAVGWYAQVVPVKMDAHKEVTVVEGRSAKPATVVLVR